jgi:hypothetical protein
MPPWRYGSALSCRQPKWAKTGDSNELGQHPDLRSTRTESAEAANEARRGLLRRKDTFHQTLMTTRIYHESNQAPIVSLAELYLHLRTKTKNRSQKSLRKTPPWRSGSALRAADN